MFAKSIQSVLFPITFLIFVTIPSVTNIMSCNKDDSITNSGPLDDTAQLHNLYDSYQKAIKDGSSAGFNSLFIEPKSPIFIVVYQGNTPDLRTYSALSWSSRLRPGAYEVEIESIRLKIFGNMALSYDDFHSSKNWFGKHLNSHIKTDKGWKIISVNVTDKPTDTPNPDEIGNSVDSVVSSFVESYNNRQGATIKDLIFPASSRIFHVHAADSIYTEPYDDKLNNFSAFADSVSQMTNDYRLSLDNPVIEIVDNYMASLVADYQIKSGETVVEEGLQIWTLVPLSVSGGWKITSSIWQVK